MIFVRNKAVPPGLAVVVHNKRQAYAELYGMGDVEVGRKITGQYPNKPGYEVFKL